MQLDDIVNNLHSPKVKNTIDGLQEAIVVVDSQGNIKFFNFPFTKLIEYYHGANPAGRNIFRDYPFEAREEKVRLLEESIQGGMEQFSSKVEYTRINGDKLYLNIHINPFSDKSGAQIGFVDVTKEIMEAIKDELTAAYTQSYFRRDLLPKEIKKAERDGSNLAIIVADLKEFKTVNDKYGHPIGDQFLRNVARLLQSNIRPDDSLVRYGGDEFYILLPNTNIEAAQKVVERLKSAIQRHNRLIRDEGLKIKMDFGPFADNKDYDEIIAKADAFMYANKRGVNNS